MRDIVDEVEEMLKPANMPMQLQLIVEDGMAELARYRRREREVMSIFAPDGEADIVWQTAVGRSPSDCGSLCAYCPNPGGCPGICALDLGSSRGER